MCCGIWNLDQKRIVWERRKVNQTWHMLFFWHKDVAQEGGGRGVTPLTKAGSASCLIPTLSILFIFCQQWQINRKAFFWCPCRLQKCFTWIFSVSEKCVWCYQMSSAMGSVTEVPWAKASFPPHARGSACVDPKDEWEIPRSVYHGKRWWQHMRMRDGALSSSTLASSTAQIIFPVPISVWLTTIMWQGKTTVCQEQMNNGWRKLCPFMCITQPKPYGHSFSQSLGPWCKESHTLVPAYMQITASTTDHSILWDLHRMLTGFLGKEKDFSFCQCKQLARPCFGCVQIKRRVRRDSAPNILKLALRCNDLHASCISR